MALKTVSVAPGGGGGGTGTVTAVGTGTGLTGGPITTSGTISLANTTVVAATYGSATQVAQLVIDAQGRITSAANVTISGGGSGSVTSVDVSGGSTGLTTSGGPVTTSGTITLGGTLAVASGGTGTSTPSLVAGTNVTVTGTWPNQTINASGGSGSGTVNSGTSGQLTYYASTGTAVSGNANATISGGTVTLGTAGSTAGGVILSGSTSGTTTLRANAAAGTWTLTLPTTSGTNGYVLSTDGSGNTSWIATSGGGGTVTSVNVSGGSTGLTTSGGPVTGSGTITLAGTLAVANGGTGVTTSSGANSVVLRDASSNITGNSFFEGFTSVAAAGTTTTLTAASTPTYVVTGSGGQTYRLPDATTLPAGAIYSFNNNQTTGTVIVQNNSGTTLATLQSGAFIDFTLLVNSPAAGTWDTHAQTPSNVSWSTNTLDWTGSITSATWNGATVAANRGGTAQSTYTTGDVLYASASNTLSKLTIGTTGQVLTVASGVPSWATGGSGTVNSGTAGQLTYYASTGTAVSGNANATISGGALTLGVAGTAAGSTVFSGSTSGAVTVQSAATAGTWTMTLPTSGGTSGYVLRTDGAGVTSWVAQSGGGGLTYSRTSFTATAGQTTFTVTYTVANVQVYVNGILLATSEYTATNGTSVVLGTGAGVNSIVDVITWV